MRKLWPTSHSSSLIVLPCLRRHPDLLPPRFLHLVGTLRQFKASQVTAAGLAMQSYITRCIQPAPRLRLMPTRIFSDVETSSRSAVKTNHHQCEPTTTKSAQASGSQAMAGGPDSCHDAHDLANHAFFCFSDTTVPLSSSPGPAANPRSGAGMLHLPCQRSTRASPKFRSKWMEAFPFPSLCTSPLGPRGPLLQQAYPSTQP
ncbi:hypothetical protein IWX90DRAFT_162524 [Phyllosticta citrichinensis]|uniref:Uncharacterized protein n=1 Tax=Phyllosticta citrichinensis TaxID=1130410 RepID=A0ABR1Y101_9PEZI